MIHIDVTRVRPDYVVQASRCCACSRTATRQQTTTCPPARTCRGEWAASPTPQSLAVEVAGDDVGTDREDDELVDAICDAWEQGVAATFEAACARELRAGLPDAEVPS